MHRRSASLNEGLSMANRRRTRKKLRKRSRRQVGRIDVLPDDVLLEIFDFFIITTLPYHGGGGKAEMEEWQELVHVCRRWRNIVFGSPLRLHLRLFCTHLTPARDTLNVWPALPLIVRGNTALALSTGMDNIITALGQSNRVREVQLQLEGRQLEQVLAPMQVTFPELAVMRLSSNGETLPVIEVIPDSFLGGSAPYLQSFRLDRIPFPGLPKLLSSAAHLSLLWLSDMPHSAYISPEVMVALISVLSSLRILVLGFKSPQSFPHSESRSLPPSKRFILPALMSLDFKGITEYFEGLVTRIDTPQLNEMDITFFNQIDFDCPRLAQFINRAPKLRVPDEAHVEFDDAFATIKLRYRTSDHNPSDLLIEISCIELDWQLSSIEQICNSSLHPVSTVEDLYIDHEYSELVWKSDVIGDTQWLQLLLPFTAVKNLYLSKEFAPGIAADLKGLVEGGVTEVLPSLQNIFVEALETAKAFRENIAPFVTERVRFSHPVSVSDRDKDFNMKSMAKDSDSKMLTDDDSNSEMKSMDEVKDSNIKLIEKDMEMMSM